MKLTRGDFTRACKMAKDLGGIHFDDSKKALLHARLSKRTLGKGFASIGPYLDSVNEAGRSSPEAIEFINSLTTNKTAFFRERHHFDFLVDVVARRYLERFKRSLEHGPLRVWSAAASRGHEAYSGAMVLVDALAPSGAIPSVFGTDIDTETLQTAKNATYPISDMHGLRADLRHRYFQRGVGAASGHWRLKKRIRGLVTFAHMNLTTSALNVSSKFHVIFCRNVLFYFDEPTQRRLVSNLSKFLLPGGYLIMGHSENIQELTSELEIVDGTIYQRRDSAAGQPHRAVPAMTFARTPVALVPSREAVLVGDCIVRSGAATLTTVLGSCVAVCLYDPSSACGGMCHFALPRAMDGTSPSSRYGEKAIPSLLDKLEKIGASRQEIRAKVFGACEIGTDLDSASEPNLEFAYTFLREAGIPIVAERVRTPVSLEVHLTCSTGAVRVRGRDIPKRSD